MNFTAKTALSSAPPSRAFAAPARTGLYRPMLSAADVATRYVISRHPAEPLLLTARTPLRLAVAAFVLLGLALRFWAASIPSMAHPDEIFQYLEQAHRLVFGYGVVPWEYRYGMRSWLVPLALMPFMAAGAALAPADTLYLLLPKLAAASLSLLILPAAWSLGARLSRLHALAALAVAAAWYQLVYFGAHILTETLAVSLILPAAALLLPRPQQPRLLVLAGVLLGLGAILRFHYLPALFVLVLLSSGKDIRRWLLVSAGGALSFAAGAAVDIVMGQAPFGWLLENFRQNILLNRSAAFGVSGPFEYASMYVESWGFWLVPVLLFLAPVIARYRPLFWMAVTNLLVHSAIGHKEFRFVLLTTAVLVILAVIGSVEWLQRLQKRLPERSARFAPAALILAWLGVSAAFAVGDRMRPRWTAFSAGFEAALSLRHEPKLCGVALLGMPFWEAGGYVHLHRPVPLYLVEPQDLPRSAPAFDAIIAPADASLPSAYRKRSCHSTGGAGPGSGHLHGTTRVCTFVRGGGCNPRGAEELRLDRALARDDQ